MTEGDFVDTVGTVAREAKLSTITVRLYAKLGLLETVTASNGIALHRKGNGARAKEIHKQRLANRGGNRRRA